MSEKGRGGEGKGKKERGEKVAARCESERKERKSSGGSNRERKRKRKRERDEGREREKEKDYISLVSHVRPFVQSFSGYGCGLADISAPWKPFSIQSVKSTSKSHTVFHRRGRSRRDRRLHPATVPR